MSFIDNHPRQVVLITGASDGLGLEAAKRYVEAQYTVVLAGRTPEKLAKAADAVKIAANVDNAEAEQRIYSICFDFSSLKSVRQGATKFLDLNLPLNILINNAGIITTSYGFTEDSNVFEQTIMVNMVGPLLFTELLLPRMKASGAGKILIVASNMHSPEQKSPLKLKQDPNRLILPLDNLDGSKSWDAQDFYAASKLADIWWCYALSEKLKQSEPKITVNAFCPGAVPTTGLSRDYPWLLRKLAPHILKFVVSSVLTPEKASEQYLAYGTDPTYADDNGVYYRNLVKTPSSQESYDLFKAKTVYNLACEVVGLDENKVDV